MAEDQTMLRYFSVVHGRAPTRYMYLTVPSNSTVQDVIKRLAPGLKQLADHIMLWKVSLAASGGPWSGEVTDNYGC